MCTHDKHRLFIQRWYHCKDKQKLIEHATVNRLKTTTTKDIRFFISSFRERIKIDNTPISEDDVVELLPKIFNICKDHDLHATFFEITTALALLHFFTQNVDVIVLETGLGGRLDATNIFKNPALCIITTITLEHTAILGDTIDKIALEKGGIMKVNAPVLVGNAVPHDVLKKCAIDKQVSKYYTCNDVFFDAYDLDDNSILSSSYDNNNYDFDKYNSLLSKAALLLLSDMLLKKENKSNNNQIISLSSSSSSIEKGITEKPSCRFELIQKDNKQIILDIAHNPQAIQNLLTKLQKSYSSLKNVVRFICGFSTDKDISQCLNLLLTYKDTNAIHLVQASSGRATKIIDILPFIISEDRDNIIYDINNPSVKNQVNNAINNAHDDEIIVICGSAFLMAEAREALDINEARDSDILADVYGNNNNLKHMQDNLGSFKKPSFSR